MLPRAASFSPPLMSDLFHHRVSTPTPTGPYQLEVGIVCELLIECGCLACTILGNGSAVRHLDDGEDMYGVVLASRMHDISIETSLSLRTS